MAVSSFLSLNDRVVKSSRHRIIDYGLASATRDKYKQWTQTHLEKAFIAVQEDNTSCCRAVWGA